MILPASYQSGFAPRDGIPLYPSLWRGCVFAAAPCLGPSGLTLRDWSGYGNHGTLTNMDAAGDWVASGGKYALDFDGSNDTVAPNDNAIWGNSASPLFVSFWMKSTAAGGFPAGVSSAVTTWSWVIQVTAAGKIAWWNSGSGASLTGSAVVNDGTWHHVVTGRTGTTGNWSFAIYIDGKLDAAGTGAVDPSASTTKLRFGGAGTYGASLYAGQLDDLRIYNREFRQKDASILSLRRGIAYEMAPRRRNSTQVAAFNRRRRLLLGASS